MIDTKCMCRDSKIKNERSRQDLYNKGALLRKFSFKLKTMR